MMSSNIYHKDDHFIGHDVQMHEYLEVKCKPSQFELIEYLQNYLSTLLRLSIEQSPENLRLLNENNPELYDKYKKFRTNQTLISKYGGPGVLLFDVYIFYCWSCNTM